ncbi:iron-sulfur cluster repair di-iron protein [Haoranjiania flava]|uniref:Iron-sulfur cluster repair di-iron protein n=1 Tax=Haoranjiania flava TaxID=1856322 RepID=A0AAE3ISM5_9BACT|nr:iron-sulfur cluster repair di-iron protein [Haoranjiania flava]MCU7695072.1 iron-sulfur cluster repair di-iron protein [Haoranjiania flava]
MATIGTLNVTVIEPRLKHPTIFKHFDELEPGEGFVIENDHDPKPLYYQLLGERGTIFTWEYLEQGPQWWKVRIARKQQEANAETVGEIAAKDIRKAEIFKQKGIDFCCGGDKTLKEAGEEAGISEEELKAALQAVEDKPLSASQDYNKWELDFLADYIVNTHHRYVKDNAQTISGLAEKVAQHHGENHPELKKVAQAVNHFLQDLINHTEKEEKVLFPAIKEAVAGKRNGSNGAAQDSIKQPILMMQKEHEIAGEDLTYFRKLTNDYALPADACNSYNYLFEKMKEFEADLHQHIHLENNILFPKAAALEAK